LHLLGTEALTASWILRAMIGGKRSDLGLGAYPEVSLANARERAARAREQIRDGIDPRQARRDAAAALRAALARALTFKEAAQACHESKAVEFRNAKHRMDWLSSLERHAFPTIGSLPVADLELGHVVNVLKPIWVAKTETATRVRQRIEKVIDWAIVSGFRPKERGNPAMWKGTLEHALPKPSKLKNVEHHAALPWADVPAFMLELRKRDGMGARALEFAILTAARSREVRFAEWSEIDFAEKVWRVPAAHMKAHRAHTVPLSDAAIALLEKLPRMEKSPYVFPAVRAGKLSDATLSAVTKRMKVAAVPHGFRSSFRDWCAESTNFPREVAEQALAHTLESKVEAAYRRGELLTKRAKLMAAWAKYCATLPTKAAATPIRKRR
jgi:integrase